MTAAVLATSASAQASQASLSLVLTEALDAAWPLLVIDGLKASMPEWQRAVTGIVTQLSTASAALAAQSYIAQREAAGLTIPFQPVLAPLPSPDQIAASLDYGTRGLWSRSLTDEDVANVKTIVNGLMQEVVADTGRDTTVGAIDDDKLALGFARISSPSCCAFCRMLASRGAVYKSVETASLRKSDGNAYHPHCHCQPMPVFSEDALLPEHSQQWAAEWKQVTRGLSGNAALNAWRQFVEGRQPDGNSNAGQLLAA